ncbi:MAG: isoprenylcysteine carboxylmethyltransferase family protein [Alphaproteobacteria bacterium]|nr:isoprenylcysteine carboxylmethyltransferase family protein [Alphaproteobacteria bacterium]
MPKLRAILGSVLFFIVAPGTVAGLAPWLISGWLVNPPFLGLEPLRAVGIALIAAGLVPLIDSFRRFAVEGLGTPAPIAPTEHLIVTGFYRHVRNPMYVGVVSTALGQSLLFGNTLLLAYAAAVWLGFHAFVTVYEEPTLGRQFGASYVEFCKHVPRWLPRLTPWRASS